MVIALLSSSRAIFNATVWMFGLRSTPSVVVVAAEVVEGSVRAAYVVEHVLRGSRHFLDHVAFSARPASTDRGAPRWPSSTPAAPAPAPPAAH
jgi:hypothetical protein